jgi:hypothetical protein
MVDVVVLSPEEGEVLLIQRNKDHYEGPRPCRAASPGSERSLRTLRPG